MRRRALTSAALAAAIALLGSCGGSDDNEPADVASTTTVATCPAQPDDPPVPSGRGLLQVAQPPSPRFGDVANRLHPEGGFWVAWRTRRGCGVSEDVVRRIALAAGMVGNKACSIDPTWSGMRLVLRTEIRDALMYRVQPPPPPVSRRMRRPTQPPRLAHRTLARSVTSGGSTLRRVRASKSK